MNFDIHHIETTLSTQDELYSRARDGAATGTIVCAARQTGGRGRQGRTWESPAGNLYFSLLICEPDLPAHLSGESAAVGDRGTWGAGGTDPAARLLPLIAGLAVADLAETLSGMAQIKWPNDVIVLDRKLAGILCENRNGLFLIGVGINVHSAPIDSAISLADAAGTDLPPLPQLLDGWTDLFARRLTRADTVSEVESRLYGKNRPASHAGRAVTILGLDADGFLLVCAPGGRAERVTAGDVTPADLYR